jgi:orotidine-5'-phosphate decarboxylase
MIPPPANPVIVALDVSDLDDAERLASTLAPEVGMLKVGFELFWAHGPDAVRRMTPHGDVFMDSKLHDIPNTVERASANIARLGVAMFNVHALGGDAMMRAAMEGAKRGADEAGMTMPLVIAATVLSSHSGEDLATPASLAWEAKVAGLDGVVVSGEDVRDVRDVCGDAFCLVVPGIRPEGVNGHDQVRVLTPRAAIDRGADYLVVGRAITTADDPVGVARMIVRDVR